MQAEYGSRFSRNAWRMGVYGALISGSIIFAMPFIWMISTSLKEDDEQVQRDLVWVPRLPPDCPCSPYIDARGGLKLEAPSGVKAEVWKELWPVAEASLAFAVAPLEDSVFGATPPKTGRELLIAAVWNDISGKIAPERFTSDSLVMEIKRFATPEQIQQSLNRIFDVVAFGNVLLRAEGKSAVMLRVDPPDSNAKEPADGKWTIETAGTQMVQRSVSRRIDNEVHYTFQQPGERTKFSTVLPFADVNALKTYSIRIKGDGSWNRFWTAIDFNGVHYESVTPYLLSGRRFGEVYFQLPSPDDDNDMLTHDWITTKGTGVYNSDGPKDKDVVRLNVWIENTSLWTKIWDKFTYNYSQALRYIPFWRYLLTSILLVINNVALNILSSSLVAYSFARLNWPGRKYCWALLLATVMIPGQVTMIPGFLIFKWLGWFNTLRPLWIGSCFGNVFFVFMLREFMKGIPKDLEDSAKIDGCSYYQIYWHVIIPLVKPTLAAIGIFTFMGTWNEFMGPLMYLSDQKMYPLSLGLFAFQTVAGSNQGMMMAASLMMTLPVIALFFVAQRQFIQGVTFTGIKG